jgi:hypothetical protein
MNAQGWPCVIGAGVGDIFLNLQFNTSKRALKAVQREGTPMVRDKSGVGMGNHHTVMGRPHPTEGNPTTREEARVGDDEPTT